MATHPEWALAHKRTGTELRLLNGKYYLYEVTSKWNKEKKRSQKITGKLLGTINQKDGFVESTKRKLEHKPSVISSVCIKEYGITHFMESVLTDYKEKLAKHFPRYWREILCLAYGRLAEQSPLKNMEHHYLHSYLSELYPELDIRGKTLSVSLRELGYEREKINAFFREFAPSANDCILFDGTDILSRSSEIGLCEMSKCKKGTYESVINAMFIFSVEMQLPIYYRLLNGKIKDVKSFKLCLKESGIKDAVIISDKGFYSQANIAELETEQLKYIIPLCRNNTLIDYSIIDQNNKRLFNGYFEHEKRFIWHYCIPINENTKLFIYLDEELRTREERDFLNRVDNKIEGYNIDKYYQKQHAFGTIAMLSNADKEAGEIYTDYKSRAQIEEMIDSMKTVVESDKTYMQNEQTLEAWMFINYIALHWYYIILKLLKTHKLNDKFSPSDLLIKLKDVRKAKINGQWYNAETTAKTSNLMKTLGIHIT